MKARIVLLFLFITHIISVRGGEYGKPLTAEVLDAMNKLDIPVLFFTLENGEFPSSERMEAPEGCMGATIINNNYVAGQLVITRKGQTIYDSGVYKAKESGVRLRERGNTSAYSWKNGFKIKLSKKAVLPFSDKEIAKSKDYVLIGNERYLRNQGGEILGNLCELGWQPHGDYVFLVINDVFKGIYCLKEAITTDKGRLDVEKTGVVIENDAYWWKPGEKYFKSNHLPDKIGWTFKSPDADDIDETYVDGIRQTVNEMEDVLYSDEDVNAVIDVKSFAGWLLAHDIMSTFDGAGSNLFMIKDNHDAANPFAKPFRLGPLWDFDACFIFHPDDRELNVASIHNAEIFYFPQLLKKRAFVDAYVGLWEKISPSLKADFMGEIDAYIANHADLEAARELEGRTTGWKYEATIEECRAKFDEYISRRIEVMNENVRKMQILTSIDATGDDCIAQIPAAIPADGGAEWLRKSHAKAFAPDGTPARFLRKGINILVLPGREVVKVCY